MQGRNSKLHIYAFVGLLHQHTNGFDATGPLIHDDSGLFRGQDRLHNGRHRFHGQGALGEAAAELSRGLEDLPADQAEEGSERARKALPAAVLAGKFERGRGR